MTDNAVHTVRSAISASIWTLEDFIREVDHFDGAPLHPFSDVSVEFCAQMSAQLLGLPQVRATPEIVALAYWLRPGPIRDASDWFHSHESDRILLAPRGRVFHVPPANVDTIFVYSWVLSMLAGNTNIIRLSEKPSMVVDLLLSVIRSLFASDEFAPIARRNHFVHTGHDDAISARISAVADVRVVWGGDATVRHFRQFPLAVHGRDLMFPNRHSFAVFAAEAVARSDERELSDLVGRFFNDAYWFDQGGCSSPRLIIWHDPNGDAAEAARERFHATVTQVIEAKGYEAETGSALEKLVMGFRSIVEQDVVDYSAPTNEATWIELESLDRYSRENCGGGLFFEYTTAVLEEDLARFVCREDQTVGYFGIGGNSVRAMARRLNGRGVDRWVPVGQALDFDRVWDGYDLLQEFSRRVSVVDEDSSRGSA